MSSTLLSSSATGASVVSERLEALRQKMREQNIDAMWVGSGDPYLSEYVPVDESLRAYISGFRGSMGDVVVTHDRAMLIVDGRYRLQASQQAPNFEVTVVPLGTSITTGWLQKLSELVDAGVKNIGLESSRTPCLVLTGARRHAATLGLDVVLLSDSLIESVRRERKEVSSPSKGEIFPCPIDISGTVKDRLAAAGPLLKANGVDGQLIVALDELAWAVNARGTYFPFQATFPARAIVFEDRILLEVHDQKPKSRGQNKLAAEGGEFDSEHIEVVDNLSAAVSSIARERGDLKNLRIGYDASTTTEAARAAIENAGANVVQAQSPFHLARTKKSPNELAHMVHGFHRADVVVQKLQTWLSGAVSRGESITEAQVANKLAALYRRSGAWGLSFQPICGADAHGAIIHYATPDDKNAIAEGALFLCDSGGYYEGGYATDLTRTFVVGKSHVRPSERQKMLFTTVLKAAIAGMRARFPKGTSGDRLDAIVRAPMWAAGLNYAHGTGHGVGVNVHEAPPRIAPNAAVDLDIGQVFSIEPGVYIEGELGIRIENICTVEEDREDSDFLRVRPLTFSPFDKRLIEKSLLTTGERQFLTWFAERFKEQKKDPLAPLNAPLPPLTPS